MLKTSPLHEDETSFRPLSTHRSLVPFPVTSHINIHRQTHTFLSHKNEWFRWPPLVGPMLPQTPCSSWRRPLTSKHGRPGVAHANPQAKRSSSPVFGCTTSRDCFLCSEVVGKHDVVLCDVKVSVDKHCHAPLWTRPGRLLWGRKGRGGEMQQRPSGPRSRSR